jgi:toxin ParE1/3/4
VIILPSAEADIDRLVDFVLAQNPVAALAIYDRLRGGVLPLTDFPELGRIGQLKSTRELLLLPYVVIYQVTLSAIEILHIYHGAEDRIRE